MSILANWKAENGKLHGSRSLSTMTDVLDLIGNTALLRLDRVLPGAPEGVEIYGKAEHTNPGGSVKDRPALNMVLKAEAAGQLRPGMHILEATSGNTGIALAMIGAAKGYPVTLCLPSNASPERKRTLSALGAELVLTDPGEGTDGAIRKAREMLAQGDWFYPDQYSNPNNWKAHFETTGPEIWQQSEGRITHFVAGLGTSGTFMGVGRFLRERAPEVELVSLQPDSPWHGLEGLKHMESAMVPAIYDPELADRNFEVDTEEAQAMTVSLARRAGLLVGVSAGANLVGALQLASTLKRGVIVTILCDTGYRYLEDAFWEAV